MEKNTTLKDIADKLGISVSTVSRVINGNSVKRTKSFRMKSGGLPKS